MSAKISLKNLLTYGPILGALVVKSLYPIALILISFTRVNQDIFLQFTNQLYIIIILSDIILLLYGILVFIERFRDINKPVFIVLHVLAGFETLASFTLKPLLFLITQ